MPKTSYAKYYKRPSLLLLEGLIKRVENFFPGCVSNFRGTVASYLSDREISEDFVSAKEFFLQYQNLTKRSGYFGFCIRDEEGSEVKADISFHLFDNRDSPELDLIVECDDEVKSDKIIRLFDSELKERKSVLAIIEEARGAAAKLNKVTDEAKSLVSEKMSSYNADFIDVDLIKSFESGMNSDFNYARLVILLKELNSSYNIGNYNAAGILIRAIMDHIPPALGCKSFEEVANNYQFGKSAKKAIGNLQNFMRHLSDDMLHNPISKKESGVVSKGDVDCRQALKFLLDEVVSRNSCSD
jgi:hypothetical protein